VKHKYDFTVTVNMYLELDSEKTPDYIQLRREILKSLDVGYFGHLQDFKITYERHGEDAEGPRKS